MTYHLLCTTHLLIHFYSSFSIIRSFFFRYNIIWKYGICSLLLAELTNLIAQYFVYMLGGPKHEQRIDWKIGWAWNSKVFNMLRIENSAFQMKWLDLLNCPHFSSNCWRWLDTSLKGQRWPVHIIMWSSTSSLW